MSERPAVYLAFGSNLGDRERNIAGALGAVGVFARVEAVSALYETDPVPPGQPPYLNAACRIRTELAPEDLLRHVKDVERELGRRGGARWGPRPIDIDVLLYGNLVIEDATFHIPHEGLVGRPFVLVPLADVGASAEHPVLAKRICEIAEVADRAGVRLLLGAGWEQRWLRSVS
jgi:2-amino-4-hydroxy-6-hydroxymethyldihydropteridine diphosphokinase